ncbi:MAG: L,D-transpeptidase family protein [Thermoanaerobaculia bacterium]
MIVIKKSDRSLSLMKGGHVLRTYRVALGPNPVGPKEREGDGRTPEGAYVVDFHKTDSAFHIALQISYPTPNQGKAAAARGVRPGGDIMIHGIRNGLGFVGRLHTLADWTQGCIAVTDPEIEEIARAVPDGTPVKILP